LYAFFLARHQITIDDALLRAGKMLAPTNRAAETAAAKAAANELWRLSDMSGPFGSGVEVRLSNNRNSVADCRTDAGPDKNSGRNNSGYGGGDTVGYIREHFEILPI
jgi:hypothetical protein